MNVLRCVSLLAAIGGVALAQPAAAQFFLQSPDIHGGVVRGDEPGIGETMPGATDAEVRAELVWNMRSGLNVAALQCQFEPTLMSVQNYNTLLYNHRAELKAAFDTLTKYFTRTNKVAKAGQTALDRFGTRTYTGFTAVASQSGCSQTAAASAAPPAPAPPPHSPPPPAAHPIWPSAPPRAPPRPRRGGPPAAPSTRSPPRICANCAPA